MTDIGTSIFPQHIFFSRTVCYCARKGDGTAWNVGESRTVTVLGLNGEGDGDGGEESDCNSEDITMLLRLQGPEALAEVISSPSKLCFASTRTLRGNACAL